MTVEVVVGVIMTAMIGCLAFFLARFINRYDEFEKSTLEAKNKRNLEIYNMDKTIESLATQIKESGFDPKTKSHITLLSNRVNKLDAQLKERTLPLIEKVDENHGRILALDKKLVTLFKTVELLVTQKEKPGRE